VAGLGVVAGGVVGRGVLGWPYGPEHKRPSQTAPPWQYKAVHGRRLKNMIGKARVCGVLDLSQKGYGQKKTTKSRETRQDAA
jgi:hypothetical protein